jgi:hypothetical protein
MNFVKSLIVLIAIAAMSACGSADKKTAPSAEPVVDPVATEWDLDTPADGKLLFKASVLKGSESAKVLLQSSDTLFVNAMMGTLNPDITKILKLTAKVKIFNLDYNEDGKTIAEIDCPDTGVILDFGTVQYSTLPNTIDLSVKGVNDTLTFSCKGSDGVRSFYVTIYKDHNPSIDDGYELKFDFEQRNFIGRLYIMDKNDDPAKVYGKTLLF